MALGSFRVQSGGVAAGSMAQQQKPCMREYGGFVSVRGYSYACGLEPISGIVWALFKRDLKRNPASIRVLVKEPVLLVS